MGSPLLLCYRSAAGSMDCLLMISACARLFKARSAGDYRLVSHCFGEFEELKNSHSKNISLQKLLLKENSANSTIEFKCEVGAWQSFGPLLWLENLFPFYLYSSWISYITVHRILAWLTFLYLFKTLPVAFSFLLHFLAVR